MEKLSKEALVDEILKELDGDKDGCITCEEYQVWTVNHPLPLIFLDLLFQVCPSGCLLLWCLLFHQKAFFGVASRFCIPTGSSSGLPRCAWLETSNQGRRGKSDQVRSLHEN